MDARLHVAGDRLIVSAADRFAVPDDSVALQRDFDEYGIPPVCIRSTLSELFLIKAATLEILAASEIPDFALSTTLLTPAGKLLGAGTIELPCDGAKSPVVMQISSDAGVTPIYQEQTVFNTNVNGAMLLPAGRLLLFGTSEREYDVFSAAERKHISGLDSGAWLEASPRELISISDGFLTELDANGTVLSKTWLQAGLSVVPAAAVLTEDRLLVAGSIGFEVMWAMFEK